MNRSQKETFVAEFRERLEQAPVLYLTDFTGLNVKSMTTLRRRLREAGAEYLVVKNRLVKRIVEEIDYPDISEFLEGPTGMVIGTGEPVGPAKAVTDFADEHDSKPVFKIGILDGQLIQAGEIEQLAQLPSREELLAQIVGVLEAPMAAFVGALEGKLQEMAGLIEALKNKKEGEG